MRVDGTTVGLDDVVRIAHGRASAVLDEAARERIAAARRFLMARIATGETLYGVNTGFGRMADVRVPDAQMPALQANLVRSHAAGTGAPLGPEAVRAILLLRANALARGQSGCRVEVVERLLALLTHDVLPVVPSLGSVGASGDLGPLAHVALAVIGEGQVRHDGQVRAARDALDDLGLEPLELSAKEGLALINGTQATTALGVLALARARSTLEACEVAGAMSLDALMGTPEAFRPEIHDARPHPGQRASAARLRTLLAGSEIRESHRHGDPRVQDSYSLRCMPQIHGAARDGLAHVERILSVEVNSTTDNPLIFPDSDLIVSGGNFHAQVVAQALDLLTIAIADAAAVAERRIERLLNPDLSGLPAFLTEDPGIRSGLMIAQITAADALSELRVLAHPASVDTVSTSAAREDHVSMGFACARKAIRSVELFEIVIALELLTAAQALEFRRPLRSSPALERVHARIRERVPRLRDDRVLAGDIDELIGLVRAGTLLESADPGSTPAGPAP